MLTRNVNGDDSTEGNEEPVAAVPRPTLDEATLVELYRLHGRYLLRALVRITSGDRGKAEDILQETFLRAWRNPSAIKHDLVGCRPWLYTVARRIAIDYFRMVGTRVKEVSDDAPEERIPTYDPFDAVLEAQDIRVMLAKLPAHHRDVLVELHLNGRSTADAASVLGIPVGTVKSRHYHAVRALRPMLEAAGGGTAA
jgi:RNA polymerase sigma-70 factor (ECF subfamily)